MMMKRLRVCRKAIIKGTGKGWDGKVENACEEDMEEGEMIAEGIVSNDKAGDKELFSGEGAQRLCKSVSSSGQSMKCPLRIMQYNTRSQNLSQKFKRPAFAEHQTCLCFAHVR